MIKSARWTSHLKLKEEKEAFEKKLKANKDILKRLKEILKEEEQYSIREMRKRDNFYMPSWAEKQAFELGYQKLANKLLTLTEV